LTLDDQPDLRGLIRHYWDAVEQVSILNCVPDRWLHVTMQSVAFVDQIDADERARVSEALRVELADHPAPTATFGKREIRTEAVYLRAESPKPLYELRLAMYDAIAGVLPDTRFTEPRPDPEEFKPHVSFAYVNGYGTDEQIKAALRNVKPEPVTVRFAEASFLVLHRDDQMWEWVEAAPLPLRA
jgi:hypothetical protein